METTKILMEEHVVILSALKKLELLLAQDLTENADELLYFYEFIQEYSDDYHHGKEEDIYFEWISEHNESLKNGPIKCMLSEHEHFRSLTRRSRENLLKFLDSKSDGDEKEKYGSDCIKDLYEFISSLRNHIQKEDQILYQMAESLDEQVGDGDKIMLDKFYDLNENKKYIIEKFSSLIKTS